MSSSGDEEEQALEVSAEKYGPDGLPAGDEKAKAASAAAATKMVVALPIISRLVGLGIAFLIVMFASRESKAEYCLNAMAAFNASGQRNGAYVFFSAVLFSLLTFWLNFYPMIPKARVMLKNKGIRPNMYIFKANNPAGAPTTPCVILEEEGDCGKYNRANRSMHHFAEYAAGCVFTAICAGLVFPFPTFILIIIIAIGRVWHQVAYSNNGYGAHAGGFALFMVGYCTLEMLSLMGGVQQLTENDHFGVCGVKMVNGTYII
jgi:hypothetical protein